MAKDERQTPAGRVTLRTIAQRAGVHASTVSRALRREGADDPTAQRIRRIAAELGYRPDVAAASLRTRRSRAIGVLVHRLTDVVQAIIFEAIERTAFEHGYQALVANTYDDFEEQCRRAELFASRRVDGLILADAQLDGRYVDWVAGLGVPFMLVSRHVGGHPSVTGDDYLGGRLAGAHIADLGHERVAVLSGMPFSSATTERAGGCMDALRDRGIDVTPDLVEPCLLDEMSGRDAMHRVLERRTDVTAVFSINDFNAFGAMLALREHSREPGRDVALVGYNDVPIARTIDLTTIRSPHLGMGSLATRLLLDVMSGRQPDSVRLAPELVVRGTSAAAPVGSQRSRKG